MLKILGCRGTNSVYGLNFNKYGCYTSSLITIKDNKAFIFDMGTGIQSLTLNDLVGLEEFNIFFSHIHWDHLIGILGFKPLFFDNVKINFYLSRSYGFKTLNEFLSNIYKSPFFPVGIEVFKAQLRFYILEDKNHYEFEGLNISYMKGNHPDSAMIYKIKLDDKVYIYATDYEHSEESDIKLIKFAKGADYLIYDTTYLPEDYDGKFDGVSKKGWGHSTYIKGCDIATKAEVTNLVLFHHNPDYNDEVLETMYLKSLKIFSNSIIAKDNLQI